MAESSADSQRGGGFVDRWTARIPRYRASKFLGDLALSGSLHASGVAERGW